MEVILSAALGELGSRSISFLVDRYLKQTAAPTEAQRLCNLQRLLLRLRVIVEEADGRLVTNQAMLHQLRIMKKEMYRGYYTLASSVAEPMEKTGQKITRSITPLRNLSSILPSVYVSAVPTMKVRLELSFWRKLLAT
jgi:hypothetical protein